MHRDQARGGRSGSWAPGSAKAKGQWRLRVLGRAQGLGNDLKTDAVCERYKNESQKSPLTYLPSLPAPSDLTYSLVSSLVKDKISTVI